MTSKIVVDTSIIIKWLNKTNEQHIEKTDKLMESALAGTTVLIAPELSKYEIGNVLLTGKKLNPREANVSLGTSYSLPITFITESEDLAKETSPCRKQTYHARAFFLQPPFQTIILQLI